MPNWTNDVRKKIYDGDTKGAINLFLSRAKEDESLSSVQDQLVLISARYSNFFNKDVAGRLPSDSITLENINDSIIKLVQYIDKEYESEKKPPNVVQFSFIKDEKRNTIITSLKTTIALVVGIIAATIFMTSKWNELNFRTEMLENRLESYTNYGSAFSRTACSTIPVDYTYELVNQGKKISCDDIKLEIKSLQDQLANCK